MNPTDGNNALVVQSGGCTPVMNRSLVGVVRELLTRQAFGEIYGAVHGFTGVLDETFVDLRRQPRTVWARIGNTPAAALGSARHRPSPEDVPRIADVLRKYQIGYLFTIGGNDSAETAHRIALQTEAQGQPLAVVNIPKTIDNDLPHTDHCPGYGSAARFVALATMGAGRDAESMGKASPVTVLEVMGRNAGWLAASSALAKRDERDAPHFICLPEVTVDEDRLLSRLEEAYRRWGFAVVVTAENTRGQGGVLGEQEAPFYVDDFGHKYYEGSGRYLAHLLGRHLKVRVRYEKPGTIQRSLMACLSRTDAQEATLVGQAAVRYALEGHSDCMVTLVRQPTEEYQCGTGLVPLQEVAGQERPMPPEYIDAPPGYVTPEFLRYARPLIGGPLPRFGRLAERLVQYRRA